MNLQVVTKIPSGTTAAALMESLRKLHFDDEGDYLRYVEQKFMDALTNALTLIEVIKATEDSQRIAEASEGLSSNFLNQILTDIESWKKESEGGTNAVQK